ncbi:hypothetical protein WA026_016775 [Henosepilachna vigintioctopunctata]|uniref:Uncharacterized protein n=1 Tax=Henosepilachna vigintioctopunctata TaxID=420089 RepID=A0AAW1V012_9CUCU
MSNFQSKIYELRVLSIEPLNLDCDCGLEPVALSFNPQGKRRQIRRRQPTVSPAVKLLKPKSEAQKSDLRLNVSLISKTQKPESEVKNYALMIRKSYDEIKNRLTGVSRSETNRTYNVQNSI